MDKLFASIYSNLHHPASFSNVSALYKAAKKRDRKVKLSDVKKWLAGQDTYTLHKNVRRRFPRNKVVVSSIDEEWALDLVEMKSLQEHNDGYKFLLTCIDILSKFAFVQIIKTKSANSVRDAFSEILTRANGRIPCRVWTDKG